MTENEITSMEMIVAFNALRFQVRKKLSRAIRQSRGVKLTAREAAMVGIYFPSAEQIDSAINIKD